MEVSGRRALRRAAWILAAATAVPGAAAAQAPIPVSGDRLTGFVLPVEPIEADVEIEAQRAWAWTVEDTSRLYADRQVSVRIGEWKLRGTAAVVWINRIRDAAGPINQIAVFFERLEAPAHRSGLGAGGRDVLLTASARGAVRLDVARLTRRPPPPRALVARGEQRLAEYLRGLVTDPPRLARRPRLLEPEAQPAPAPTPGAPLPSPAPEPEAQPAAETGSATPPLFEAGGTVWLSWGDLEVRRGERENVLTATRSVVVQYLAARGEGPWSQLTLSARRAVVFADPGPLDELLAGRASADAIRGIYLEGNVVATADPGGYTLRAPQIYYDLRTNQALLAEAVLRTYSRREGTAIYARADEMRQLAANQWSARRARVSTSEFFTPHLALGARRVTITQPRPADGADDQRMHFDSRDNTVEVAGLPVLYWPRFAGTARDVPLKRVEVGQRDSEGVRVLTTWDPFVLLGGEAPSGVEAGLRADGYTDRGAGVGLEFSYDLASLAGAADLYGLHDDGIDRTSSGLDVDPSRTFRGVALWEHRQRFDDAWSFQGQTSWISDPSFVTTWREDDFAERREYETTAYLKHRRGNAALTGLFKTDLNDFTSNSYLLASRQYQVEKLPEAAYRRYGDSLFGDHVTYSGETRAGRVRFSFEQSTPRELGVPGAAFGLGPDDRVDAALRARGLSSEAVGRFDTRHEVSVPVKLGAVNAVPFLVGRFTAYSDDFEQFSTDARDARAFGAAGLRLHAELQRVFNEVESRLFDLHRLRHILEPRVLVWYGAADVDDGDLPVYDEDVESLGTGAAVEVAVNNTWQTKRGGPGRWHSVDFLSLDAGVVFNSDDANRESPIPRFFEYRPELSRFGDHIFSTLQWLLSDHLSVVGQGTWDLDESVLARGAVGVELRHSPVISTFVEYRFLEASDNQLLEAGWIYELSPKYRLTLRPQWDFINNEFRALTMTVVRRFPDFNLELRFRRDEIADETTVSASLDLVRF